eukprot:TRINITY_DN908_c0_g2_i3.p1 TRINITY_DN908_c0_g2~~TRINITY_DN908_c0_g2_i3.p1  ORF type:complete len:452 (-),score=140.28 TRINITY_DN908_c0_g2_i3:366-1655(-)
MSTITICYGSERNAFSLEHVSSFRDLTLLVNSSTWAQPLSRYSLHYHDEDGDDITVANDCDLPALKEVAALSPRGVHVLVRSTGSSSASLFSRPIATGAAAAAGGGGRGGRGSSGVTAGAVDMPCGQRFSHVLRIRNESLAEWRSVRVVHAGGERFGSFPSYLVGAVPAGGERLFSLGLVAPQYAGTFHAEWAVEVDGSPQPRRLSLTLRTAARAHVLESGVFPGLDGVVYDTFPGLRPLARPEAENVSGPRFTKLSCKDVHAYGEATAASSHLLRECVEASPGACLTVTRAVRNTSGRDLPYGCAHLVHVEGDRFGSFVRETMRPLAAGHSLALPMHLRAPAHRGVYSGKWEVRCGDRVLDTIEVTVVVRAQESGSGVFKGLGEGSLGARAGDPLEESFAAVHDGVAAAESEPVKVSSLMSAFVGLFR